MPLGANPFQAHMDVVFLVYGLAFLGLGLAIVIRNDRDSELTVSRLLWLLAAFAFVHGFLEWTDLWRVVRGDTPALAAVRPWLLLASYLFLFEFGRRLVLASLPEAARQRPAARLLGPWLHLPMLLAILAGSLAADQPALALAIGSRYLPGFLGSCLAGAGCYLYCHRRLGAEMAAPDLSSVHFACNVAAVAFAAYGVFGGLVVPRADLFPASAINQESFLAAVGVPVQLLRAGCAVLVALSVGSLLRVFAFERRRKLSQALDASRQALDELQRMGHRNAVVLDSASEGIVGLDPAGNTIFANAAALAMLGFRAEELMGKPFHALTHHTTAAGRPYPAEDCPIYRTMENHATRRTEDDVFWRRDGTSFAVEYNSAPLRDGERILGVVVVFEDISERRAAAATLADSESRFRRVSALASDLVYSCRRGDDGIFRFDWLSGNSERLFGYGNRELMARGCWQDFVVEDDQPLFAANVNGLAPGRSGDVVIRIRSRDGALHHVRSFAQVEDDTAGGARHVLYGSLQDITERAQAERALALASFMINHMREAAYLADEAGCLRFVNDEACRLLERSREELLALRVADVDDAFASPERWAANWKAVRASGSLTFESSHGVCGGRALPVEINANYLDFDGQPYVLHLVRNISERKQAEEQIRNLAYFDSLTNLPNRRLLMDRLGQALIASSRSQAFGALMMLDLDNFKTLNDTRGHDTGDRLLVAVAQRLCAGVRAEDTVSRVGGDEFVVMVEGLGDDEARAAAQAEAIAEKARQALNRPYFLGGDDDEYHSTPSIGLVLFRGQDPSIETLLKQADLALYQAKDSGRNASRFFNPDMQAAIDARSTLETALRRGMQEGQLRLFYQPQIDEAGLIVGAEALLRWLPAGGGLVPPSHFIPLAEDTGLIVPIGAWAIETACAQLKAWATDPRTRDLRIAVNVSARQFRQPEFYDLIRGSLAASGADPSRLKLELTESVVLNDIEEVIGRMTRIRALGVGFSLDDFGTGFSSLSYLKRLPLDEVKIDQSFVRDVTSDPNDAAIVRAILAMSQSLGLKAIAEGVETEAQRDFLRQNGCTRYQGYLFGKPMRIEEWGRALYGD